MRTLRLRRIVPSSLALAATLAVLAVLLLSAGCGKTSRAATSAAPEEAPPSAPRGGDCGHAACGNNFFVDLAGPPSCAIGAPCSVALTLVATGDFHINDEYPYKFKADDAKGVDFLGTDGAGKGVFSKAANNWRKNDEKTGVMSLSFRGTEKGDKTISGTFKLSVCSAQSCQLEQQPLTTTVSIR
jgi:hypothetical protein